MFYILGYECYLSIEMVLYNRVCYDVFLSILECKVDKGEVIELVSLPYGFVFHQSLHLVLVLHLINELGTKVFSFLV